jgi:H+/Cl- antiporter ClcA
MNKSTPADGGIPVSLSLPAPSKIIPQSRFEKKRVLFISAVSIGIAVVISIVARLLIYLINLVTNISFFGEFDIRYHAPGQNHLGLWVIAIPALGGVIVGLMAYFGSKAIRGHGIPEAMEQILVNQSRIKPSITFLKPLSSAISIGTGGPFGAEGPIIATGGAFGSTIGQILRITPTERKILLTAGATAGMSAIFSTPIAGIFLAIELLLFEFSPRAIIPVALACITGAAGHHVLFDQGPVFPMPNLLSPSTEALAFYSILGIATGVVAAVATKIVYFVEDNFEKIPIHWMWWPALGGIAVGAIGYFAPRTLGVGYENITDILKDSFPVKVLLALCLLKFLSWAIALGSGTSGGTLAPLLTIGAATGSLMGGICMHYFPSAGITIPMSALIGMSAMFAGASRALLTSIVFALESTMQSNAILPLLGSCTASYFVSFFLMQNTIMTEKIARRGIKTPQHYEPDILEKIAVWHVLREETLTMSMDNCIRDAREWLEREGKKNSHLVIVDNEGSFRGIINLLDTYNKSLDPEASIETLIKPVNAYIAADSSLREAVELMAVQNLDILPVLSAEEGNKVLGVLSYKDILKVYKNRLSEEQVKGTAISLKRKGIRIIVKGQKLWKSNS